MLPGAYHKVEKYSLVGHALLFSFAYSVYFAHNITILHCET